MRRLVFTHNILVLFLFPGLFFHAAAAQEMRPPLALVGGALIDGNGSHPIRDSVIVIEGARIVAVGTVETLTPPEGATIISTEGMSVLPGLWDAHVHLMINAHAAYEYWHKTYKGRFRDEIMPASAHQLLYAGVTSARDMGAPLDDIIAVRDRIRAGEIPGPRMFVSGPFLQKAPYADWNADYRWGVDSVSDARAKTRRLCAAGVDFIKLVDQDQLALAEARAIVDTAHSCGLKVIAHAHRPKEILIGLEIGVDDFEHTGLAAAPEYPEDVMAALHERTAQMNKGPLFWTPTISGLWNYEYVRDHREGLDDPRGALFMPEDVYADILASLQHPERLGYFQITPDRKPTLKRKFQQLKGSGVKLLIGTDSGIPLKFHSMATWNELRVWVRELGAPAEEAIRSATYWPAVQMGVADDLGTVEAGKFADIIAVKGDVLRDIELLQDVDIVIKGGVRYK